LRHSPSQPEDVCEAGEKQREQQKSHRQADLFFAGERGIDVLHVVLCRHSVWKFDRFARSTRHLLRGDRFKVSPAMLGVGHQFVEGRP
jgi:hypothetical protein